MIMMMMCMCVRANVYSFTKPIKEAINPLIVIKKKNKVRAFVCVCSKFKVYIKIEFRMKKTFYINNYNY